MRIVDNYCDTYVDRFLDFHYGREKPNNSSILQTFFHWVIKDGKYYDGAYDNNYNLKKYMKYKNEKFI